jgi:hypothetical protein
MLSDSGSHYADYLLNIRALSSRVLVTENSQHAYEQEIDVKQMTACGIQVFT